jgi:uncharacterized membrane protein YkvA (DUF1232 family)
LAIRPNTAEDRLMSMPWWSVPLSVACAVAAVWVILVVALWASKPDAVSMRDALRLLPDVVRLIKGLASDPDLPRMVRVELLFVLAFMLSPIDLIPDFIPVIGIADDVILVALVLRSVTRIAGPAALTKHWPGTPDGLVAVRRLCGMPQEHYGPSPQGPP